MKLFYGLVAMTLLLTSSAEAALVNVADFFKGTGVSVTAGVDTKYFVGGSGSTYLVTGDIPADWAPPKTNWVNSNPLGNSVGLAGPLTYSTSFTLASAITVGNPLIPTTGFSFDVAADNYLTVRVNGTQVYTTAANAYTSLVNITPTLKSGVNTIEFDVFNVDGPTGLLVTNVQGSYEDDITVVIPEPASLAVWGGVVGLGMLVRRRKK